MRGDAKSTAVLSPRSAKEALASYAKVPDAVPFAGGTDLMVLWNLGLYNGRTMLDLSRVSEWRGIEADAAGVAIGALTTHAEILRHPVVKKEFPLLAQACATVGAAQIQNRGTLGGNIANASPAGDTFPPLAVYEAVVRVAGPAGRRSVPLSDVFAGVKKTTLGKGELIESVFLPYFKKPSRAKFRKVGTRAAQAISKTMFAGLLRLEGKRVAEARLAFGSLAPTVRRLKTVESYLAGRTLDDATVAEAASLLDRDVSPINDVRSTREYRLTVSRNILSSFLKGEMR